MKLEIVCKPWNTMYDPVIRYPEDAYEWDGMVTEKMRKIGKGFWRDKNEKFRAYIDCEIFNNDFTDKQSYLPNYWNEIILNSIKIIRDKKINQII